MDPKIHSKTMQLLQVIVGSSNSSGSHKKFAGHDFHLQLGLVDLLVFVTLARLVCLLTITYQVS